MVPLAVSALTLNARVGVGMGVGVQISLALYYSWHLCVSGCEVVLEISALSHCGTPIAF